MLKKPSVNKTQRSLILDTSALISLSAGGILDLASEVLTLCVSEEVKEEVERLSRFSQQGAEAFHLIVQGRIKVLSVKNKAKVNSLMEKTSNVDLGEATSAILVEEMPSAVMITDDFNALFQLKNCTAIDVHPSVYVVAALVIKGEIALEKAEEYFERIASRRHWLEATVYKYAKRYLRMLLE